MLTDIVSLDRYPIDALDSPPGQALVRRCRAELRSRGAFTLPGFLSGHGLGVCAADAATSAPRAYFSADRHNPVFGKDDPSLPPGHPWRHFETKQVGFVGNDKVNPDSALQRLYEWPALAAFLAAALGHETLYVYGDPLAALSVNVMRDGDHLGWHFDSNDFVVSLPLQSPAGGGRFEYCPYIWDRESPHWQPVSDALAGDRSCVRTLDYEAGTLVVFCGRYSLHRVTAVSGETARLVAILSYHHAPGASLANGIRMQVYGRLS